MLEVGVKTLDWCINVFQVWNRHHNYIKRRLSGVFIVNFDHAFFVGKFLIKNYSLIQWSKYYETTPNDKSSLLKHMLVGMKKNI